MNGALATEVVSVSMEWDAGNTYALIVEETSEQWHLLLDPAREEAGPGPRGHPVSSSDKMRMWRLEMARDLSEVTAS